MAETPEIIEVEPKVVTETFESLVWDGSNTVKVMKFLGDDWSLVKEAEHSDVSGRTWTVPKHLVHGLQAQRAFVGDILMKSSGGDTWTLTVSQFEEAYKEVGK